MVVLHVGPRCSPADQRAESGAVNRGSCHGRDKCQTPTSHYCLLHQMEKRQLTCCKTAASGGGCECWWAGWMALSWGLIGPCGSDVIIGRLLSHSSNGTAEITQSTQKLAAADNRNYERDGGSSGRRRAVRGPIGSADHQSTNTTRGLFYIWVISALKQSQFRSLKRG